MHNEALMGWRQECDAIEQEMDSLIKGPVPASAEERQIRRIQFVALVERREDAARKLIQADRTRLRYSWRGKNSASGEYFISAAQTTSTGDTGSTTFVKLPGGRRTADAHEASSNSSAIDVCSAEDSRKEPIGHAAPSISAPLDPVDGPESGVLADAGAASSQVIVDAPPSDPRSPESAGIDAIVDGERSLAQSDNAQTDAT